MEIEVKYAVENQNVLDIIYDCGKVCSAEISQTRRFVMMNAVYFDTEDMALSDNLCAVRLRREGNIVVATAKWNGTSDKRGLHQRNEVNVPMFMDRPVEEIMATGMFDVEWLWDTEAYDYFVNAAAGKRLVPVLGMKYERRIVKLSLKGCDVELSLDKGEILPLIGECRDPEPICELELELMTGDVEGLICFGEELKSSFELRPENRSKYARGLARIYG